MQLYLMFAHQVRHKPMVSHGCRFDFAISVDVRNFPGRNGKGTGLWIP